MQIIYSTFLDMYTINFILKKKEKKKEAKIQWVIEV